MNQTSDISATQAFAKELIRTVLYEGYSLFPYHRKAGKNIKPVPFGVVYPEAYSKQNPYVSSKMQTECIVHRAAISLETKVQFLHLVKQETGWRAIEREVRVEKFVIGNGVEKFCPFKFNSADSDSTLEIAGEVVVRVTPLNNTPGFFKVTASITNSTVPQEADKLEQQKMLYHSMLSTNTLLIAENGVFISDQNPGIHLPLVTQCNNIGTWPVLLDESNTIMLSSPIILYDYPKINPQSSGDLFDSTEIEEALLLHVHTLSDSEKEHIGESDEKLKTMLEKISLITPEELIQFHGGMTETKNSSQ